MGTKMDAKSFHLRKRFLARKNRFVCVPVVVLTIIAGYFFGSYINRKGEKSSSKIVKLSSLIELPAGTSKVIINIGSNLDPILPRSWENNTHSIAIEPVVGDLILSHPQLSVVKAAVDSSSGLATMHVYNDYGVSSSFSKASSRQFWNSDPERDGKSIIVPVISFQELLDSIPSNIEIAFIKTDMQGSDFRAVSSVGAYLRKRGVKRLKTEVYLDNVRTYENSENDFCLHWIPYMTSIGYRLFQLGKETPREAMQHCSKRFPATNGLSEYDAYWALTNLQEDDSHEMYEYPLQVKKRPLTTNAEGWSSINVFTGVSRSAVANWTSQSGQDATVCEIFRISYGHCKSRFFVDLAANDALYLSNTRSLEDMFGWKGICIEPNFEYFLGLAQRKCNLFVAVVSNKSGDIVEFIEHPDGKPGWAGGIVSNFTDNKPRKTGQRKKRHTVSFRDLLIYSEAPKVIDYFSLDVEGAEDMVLSEDVLTDFKFLVMTIERPSQQMKLLLSKFGYLFLKEHGNYRDAMFVHRTLDKVDHVLSALGG